jgi:hypothetical protein
MTTTSHLTGPWPVRGAWALLPLTVGPALGAALDAASRPVQLTAAVLAWGVWACVLVATLLPRTVSLTTIRIAAPAAAGTGVWAALRGSGDDGVTVAAVTAAVWAALVMIAAFAPTTGDAFVDGSAYGDERRMPLRVPGPLLLGPLLVAWACTACPLLAAPLLLAAGQLVPGAIVAVAGLPLAVVAARALHGLSRRWVVFVPAGLVLHDPMTLADPVLFRRSTIAGLGPARSDTTARDLTRGAPGLALELDLVDPQPVGLVPPRGRGAAEVVELDRVLFTPTRPGAVLAEADRRRIAVG